MSSAVANRSDKARDVMAANKGLKPIKLYSHAGIMLEELGIPYNSEIMDFGDLKKDPFESINPNGRVPAIEDPNSGLSLWESGAIIQYLLETYDKGDSLQYKNGSERWEQQCWLHFQTSGQGSYYGQGTWFILYHPEKLDSCLERYGNEIRRVLTVINAHLKKHNRQYLCGDRCTFADLAFVPWHWLLLAAPQLLGEEFQKEWEQSYPQAWAWHERLSERGSVKKCFQDRMKALGM